MNFIIIFHNEKERLVGLFVSRAFEKSFSIEKCFISFRLSGEIKLGGNYWKNCWFVVRSSCPRRNAALNLFETGGLEEEQTSRNFIKSKNSLSI